MKRRILVLFPKEWDRLEFGRPGSDAGRYSSESSGTRSHTRESSSSNVTNRTGRRRNSTRDRDSCGTRQTGINPRRAFSDQAG